MAQRRAQIVGDGITERLQLLVGGLQLRRAFGDPLLEGFVEPADFSFRPFALRDVADVALDEPLLAHEIGVADELDLDPDRKSTRLNSSHANISYAVFCLKT